jgi:hypothetical protein
MPTYEQNVCFLPKWTLDGVNELPMQTQHYVFQPTVPPVQTDAPVSGPLPSRGCAEAGFGAYRSRHTCLLPEHKPVRSRRRGKITFRTH